MSLLFSVRSLLCSFNETKHGFFYWLMDIPFYSNFSYFLNSSLKASLSVIFFSLLLDAYTSAYITSQMVYTHVIYGST
jgi:hypothetical protein